jgi:hypothetical protein
MTTDEAKATIEVTYNRRINLGNFNHKDYTIKVSGTEEQIERQMTENKEKLLRYIATMQELVEVAADANALKERLEPKKEQE